HSNYNIPRANITPQSPEAISEFKKTLVFFNSGQVKKWVSITKTTYSECSMFGKFVREEAYDILSNIFEDSKWVKIGNKKLGQIKDETNHISEAGYISLSFVIDQMYH
ncbi:36180_t:CDS:2, partial [Gigaspora margarita]